MVKLGARVIHRIWEKRIDPFGSRGRTTLSFLLGYFMVYSCGMVDVALSGEKRAIMAPSSQRPPFERAQLRKKFPWILGVIASIGFMAILAFVIVTLLILQSQGVTQGVSTLTIISIVAGFVMSVCGLLLSFLQWHHPRPVDRSEPSHHALLSPPILVESEHLHASGPLVGPSQQHSESNPALLPSPASRSRHINWGEAPHSKQFYGREQELATLSRWMKDDHCRLMAILGMGGMGKTSLAATVVDQVQEHYDRIFWRSLHNAPPLSSILQECIPFVSHQQRAALPEEEDSQISLLIESFRTRRCLLVLDNAESILQGGSQAGQYRVGYEGYGRLLQRIGESRHQSCLLITSREKPKEVALLEGETAAIRSYHLAGLLAGDGREILNDKGLHGTEHTWESLINLYEGNPLALKLVGQMIREVFGGNITAFLKDGEVLFRDIRDVLEQQMRRLTEREEEIVYWLAIEREATGLDDLQEDIVHPVSKGELQEGLRSLRRRQLIETSTLGSILHNVIMEYLIDRLVDKVCEEIRTEKMVLFERHALLKAQAKDYIRESQRRLILLPLMRKLLTIFGKEALEQRCKHLLVTLREQHDHHPSYAAGNILNLLIEMGCALRGYDFSHLVVWQAYFKGVDLPEVNFAHADLAKSAFTDTFGNILCVAFSPKGDLLAAGTTTGEIRFWHAASGTPVQTVQAHADWVRFVAFSPDGKTLASGSDDPTVCLWDVNSGTRLNTLQGHTSVVWSVVFSPDGKTLASGSADQTMRLWEVSSGQCLKTFLGHTKPIKSVAFSPDGKLIVSGSGDCTVRLWEVSSGQCLNTLQGHMELVRSVACGPDGKILASGSSDQTVRLWEVSSGQCLNTLQGHTNPVESVAFSPDGKVLASGGWDQTTRLWEVSSGTCLNTLQGHSSMVWSVAFSPDGRILATGGFDQRVRLWELSSGQCLNTLQGYTKEVWSVAFSPDGTIVAGGYEDWTVRLWEVSSGTCLKTFRHGDRVKSVAFSPDGKIFASGCLDGRIRLWEVSSGQCLNALYGKWDSVRSVTFSPDGTILASGSGDPIVRLWEVGSGTCLNTLQGHTNRVESVAFSPDGSTLASGSADQTVRLWEVSSGTCLNTLQGHTEEVRSVAFSSDGKTLASGSYDGSIKLWDMLTGECLHTLRSDRPYEQMNITQVKGVTEVQKATLRSLGAIEEEGQERG
jgi:WD40 repeat protein